MAFCSNENNQVEFDLIRKEMREMENSLYRDIQNITNTVAECSAYLKNNLKSTVEGYMQRLEKAGKLGDILTDAVIGDINVLNARTKSMISVLEYGAHPNAMCDCTAAIQAAIDAANKKGAAVYFPKGVYLISNTIKLNGCSLYGEVGNIYTAEGVVIECLTRDFTAISQGDTAVKNTMFDIKNIIVKNAKTAFEIIYALNSTFEKLYAIDCITGFKIGDISAVGCMFCEFKQLYTSGCDYGVVVRSNEYFNNNQFINGFIQGEKLAFEMLVNGGYGAVGNTFQNVEFRSATGRGVLLTSCLNTTFNECYFECGGNAIRLGDKQSIFTLNGCVFAMYKKSNQYDDKYIIYMQNSGAATINNGVVFLTSEYENITFFHAVNSAVYSNIYVIKTIVKNGSASGFAFFQEGVTPRELTPAKKEQTALTGTVTINAGELNKEVAFTFNESFAAIPAVFVATIRGSNAADVSYIFSERLASGGKLLVSNRGTAAVSVSFMIYAKEI